MTTHEHRSAPRAPSVRRRAVIEVTFIRGTGCCSLDPVREVTAWYDDETGDRIAENDPADPDAPIVI